MSEPLSVFDYSRKFRGRIVLMTKYQMYEAERRAREEARGWWMQGVEGGEGVGSRCGFECKGLTFCELKVRSRGGKRRTSNSCGILQ